MRTQTVSVKVIWQCRRLVSVYNPGFQTNVLTAAAVKIQVKGNTNLISSL